VDATVGLVAEPEEDLCPSGDRVLEVAPLAVGGPVERIADPRPVQAVVGRVLGVGSLDGLVGDVDHDGLLLVGDLKGGGAQREGP
jgi:hypothetical protein